MPSGHLTIPSEKIVAVFGASDPSPGEEAYEQAVAVGRVLAEQGYVVANGGYGGTMAASARGAKSAGGRTLGVPCRVWSRQPAEWIDEVVWTENYVQRLTTLIELGRAGYVVLPGATGTLVELAWVWEHACKGWSDRPIAAAEFWKPLLARMAEQRPDAPRYVRLFSAAEELREIFPRL